MKNKFLKLHDIKQLTKVSGSKVYQMVESKQFPKPIKIGHRSVRWVREEVNEWVKEQENRGQEVKPEQTEQPAQQFKVEHIKIQKYNLTNELEHLASESYYYVEDEEVEYPKVHINNKQKTVTVKFKHVKLHTVLGFEGMDIEIDGRTLCTQEDMLDTNNKKVVNQDLLTAMYTLVRAIKFETDCQLLQEEAKKMAEGNK